MAHKSKITLIAAMRDKFDLNIADELCDYCHRNKDDPWVSVIHPDRIDNRVYLAWTTAEAQTYINDGMRERARKSKGKGNGTPSDLLCDDPLRVMRAAITLLSDHFICTAEDGMTMYRILNHEHRIVEPAIGTQIVAMVSQRIKYTLWQLGVPASSGLTRTFVDYFQHNVVMVEPPKLWAQLHDDCYCLGRAIVQPDASVPMPFFSTFLDRMNDKEAFAAWFWGIYSDCYTGRQSPYISDPTGLGAKSSAARALEKLFNHGIPPGEERPRITAALNWNILRESSHASSHFDGKKFVWIGDNKNPNILMSQAVKELLGDDMAQLNPKNLPAYSAYLKAKLMVLANPEPNITSEKHNTSRTLWIKLAALEIADKDVSTEFAKHFDAEMPGFLAFGKACYEQRVTNNTIITVNQAVTDATALKIAEYEDQFTIPFAEYFKLDEDGTVAAPKLAEIAYNELHWNEHKYGHFKAWLERTFEIVKSKSHRGGWCYKGMRVKTGSDQYHAEKAASKLDSVYHMPDESKVYTAFEDVE